MQCVNKNCGHQQFNRVAILLNYKFSECLFIYVYDEPTRLYFFGRLNKKIFNAFLIYIALNFMHGDEWKLIAKKNP